MNDTFEKLRKKSEQDTRTNIKKPSGKLKKLRG